MRKGMNMKSVSLAIVATFLAPMLYGQAPSNAATPAQQKIVWSLAAIKSNPDRGQPYNELALGYIRRVRETADTRYYDQAEAALQKSLQINPDNLEAQKTRVVLMLGRNEFAKA